MLHKCNSSLLRYPAILLGSCLEATGNAVMDLQVTFTEEQQLYLAKNKKKAKCKRLTGMQFNGITNLISKQRVCKRCAAGRQNEHKKEHAHKLFCFYHHAMAAPCLWIFFPRLSLQIFRPVFPHGIPFSSPRAPTKRKKKRKKITPVNTLLKRHRWQTCHHPSAYRKNSCCDR